MTAREARNRRRAEERKEAKLARKAEISAAPSALAECSAAEPSKRAEINRLNAQHSTGPKSPQGKMASSRNSLKHGLASGTIIVPGEDPVAFEALLHDLLEEHQPANTTEDLLIHEMAQSHWLAQRALRFQNECFAEDGVDEKRLALFLRYQTTHNRAFHKALATLLKLKKERGLPSGSGFVSQSTALPPDKGGFVPQNDRDSSAQAQFVRENLREAVA